MRANLLLSSASDPPGMGKTQLQHAEHDVQLHVRVQSGLWSSFSELICSTCLGEKWTKVIASSNSWFRDLSPWGLHPDFCVNLSSMFFSTAHPYLLIHFCSQFSFLLKWQLFHRPHAGQPSTHLNSAITDDIKRSVGSFQSMGPSDIYTVTGECFLFCPLLLSQQFLFYLPFWLLLSTEMLSFRKLFTITLTSLPWMQ